jgi:hypothetical protein
MASAFLTRIIPTGDVRLTPIQSPGREGPVGSRDDLALFRTASAGKEDLATTEEAGVDGEGARPKKAEPRCGREADDRGDACSK